MRKVSEIARLKAECENNEDAKTFIRCLPALTFVPPQDVPEAFDPLADSMPQGIDHMDEVVTYFDTLNTHTFVVVAYEAEEITIEKQLQCRELCRR